MTSMHCLTVCPAADAFVADAAESAPAAAKSALALAAVAPAGFAAAIAPAAGHALQVTLWLLLLPSLGSLAFLGCLPANTVNFARTDMFHCKQTRGSTASADTTHLHMHCPIIETAISTCIASLVDVQLQTSPTLKQLAALGRKASRSCSASSNLHALRMLETSYAAWACVVSMNCLTVHLRFRHPSCQRALMVPPLSHGTRVGA